MTLLFDGIMTERAYRSASWTAAPESGMFHGPVRFPDGSPPLPHGCRWCGRPTYEHGARDWIASVGPHDWTRPTPAQTVARMKARRAARAESRRLARVLVACERERRRRERVEQEPEPVPVRPAPRRVCDQMNHNSVGAEVFCEIQDPDHEEDHDAGDGITWPRED